MIVDEQRAQAKRKPPDLWLLTMALVLTALGVVMVFSASSVVASLSRDCSYDPMYFMKRQAVWAGVGVLGLILAMCVDLRFFRKCAFPLVLLSIGLLALVLHHHFGVVVNGARRWLSLGPLSLQPAEFAKFALILYLSDVLARRGHKVKHVLRLVPVVLIFGTVIALIEKEPDLGTAMVIGAVSFGLLWMSGARAAHLVALAATGVGLIVASIFKEPYRMQRMLAFLNPWSDPQNTGYHTIQSLIALGSGGVWGLGLGESRQKFLYLPEQYTDYIFAVLGEELGLIGTLSVLVLFAGFLCKGMQVAWSVRQPFLSLLAAGCTCLICVQAALNIGVVAGALPSTGVPLPFISYGGSSLLLNLMCVGLLLNVSTYRSGRHQETESPPEAESKVGIPEMH